MKKLLVLLLQLGLVVSGLLGKEVGKFDLSIKDDKLDVTTTSMTYYFARFESNDGTKWSDPILVSPAQSKLKVDIGDLNITWDKGKYPSLNYDSPDTVLSYDTKKTSIDPANNFVGWENSILTFQGGNLAEIGKGTKYNWAAKPTLFLLNTFTLLEIGMDGMKKATGAGTVSINASVSDTFASIKNISEALAYYSAVSETTLEVIDNLTQAYVESGKTLPVAITWLKNYHTILKELISKTSAAFGGFTSNSELKEDLSKDINEAFKEEFGAMAVSGGIVDGFKKELDKADSEDKYLQASQKALAAIYNGITAYEKKYKKTLTPEQKKKLLYTKLAFATVLIGDKFLDAYIKDEKMLPVLLDVIKDIGASVGSVFYENTSSKIPEFIAKYSSNGALATKIGTSGQVASKAFAGYELGKTIGNRAIPFLFEWILNPNYVSAGIANKEISLYSLRTKVTVTSKTTGEMIYDSTTNKIDQNVIYLHQNDFIYVNAYMQQENLFDSDRSPWNLETFIPRQPLYSIHINYSDKRSMYQKYCVTESLEYFDSYINSNILLGTPLISKTKYLGADANKIENWDCLQSSAFVGHDRFTPDTIGEVDKVKNLNTPVSTYLLLVDNINEKLLLMFKGFDDMSQNESISFHPSDVNLTSSTQNGQDQYEVSNLSLVPNDSVVKYVWSVNNSNTHISTPSGTYTNPNAPTGEYPVKVWIYTASGNIITQEMVVGGEDTNTTTTTATTSTLKQTGQTTVYAAFDDGHYEMGVPINFTKESGSDEVLDRVTGLIWQDNGDANSSKMNKGSAVSYCSGQGGGWRLPSRVELSSLVRYDKVNPSIDKTFSYTASDIYWAYDASARDENQTWTVNFAYGLEGLSHKTNTHYVRCVKSSTLPIANSGEDIIVEEGQETNLLVANIPNPQLVASFTWMEGESVLGYGSSLTTDDFVDGEHHITLVATGHDGQTNTDELLVTIVSNGKQLKVTGQDIPYAVHDDGHYESGIPLNYTKLPLRVIDRTTGLTWQDNSEANTTMKNWSDAKAYCSQLGLAGVDDWRLPSRRELSSLVRYDKVNPSIDEAFGYTASRGYWTHDGSNRDGASAWSVDFAYGLESVANKADIKNVRCVRSRIEVTANGGEDQFVTEGDWVNLLAIHTPKIETVDYFLWTEDGMELGYGEMLSLDNITDGIRTISLLTIDRDGIESTDELTVTIVQDNKEIKKTGQTTIYTAYDDGHYKKGYSHSYSDQGTSVTDNVTGVVWQDDSDTDILTHTWAEANSYCSSMSGSWRLPTRGELSSLVRYDVVSPAISGSFDNTASNKYWTISTSNRNKNQAWHIDFTYGLEAISNKTDKNFVRCMKAN